MATSATTKTTTDKVKATPPTLLDRTKQQWSTATLKAKVSAADIDALVAHLGKLKSLL